MIFALLLLLIINVGAISANEIDNNSNLMNDSESSLNVSNELNNVQNVTPSSDDSNINTSDLNESNINNGNETLEVSSNETDNNKTLNTTLPNNQPSLTVVNTAVVKGGNLYAYLKDATGVALSGIKVGLKLNGKTYTSTTDSTGKATFKINESAGKYSVKLYRNAFSIYSAVDNNFTLNVLSNKPILTVTSTKVIKNSNLYAYLKDATGVALSGIKVGLKLNGKTYTSTTDSTGKATFKINESAGKYSVKLYRNAFSIYSAVDKSFTLNVLSNKPILTVTNTTVSKGGNLYAYLKDANGVALSGIKVGLKLNGKTYTSTTDSTGKATFKINESAGKYSVKLYRNAFSIYSAVDKSFTLNVFDKNAISISDIETAATNVKNFVLTNKRLPNTVKVGGYSVSIQEFSYLMAGAISNRYKGSSSKISLISGIQDKGSVDSYLNAKIYTAQYANLANRVISWVKTNNYLPKYCAVYSSSNSNLGNAGFKIYTFAFAKILAFDKTNKNLPNYCTFESSVLGITHQNSTPPLTGSKSYSINLTGLINESVSSKVVDFAVTLLGTGEKLTKKKIVIDTDRIINTDTDQKLLDEIAKILRGKGYEVIVSKIDPSAHHNDTRDYKNVILFTLVGGLCAGTFYDMSTNYYQNRLNNNNIDLVLGCTKTQRDLASDTWLERAHDDKFSPSNFTGLNDPGNFLNQNVHCNFVYGNLNTGNIKQTANELATNFLKYAVNGLSIGLNNNTPSITHNYKATTNSEGVANLVGLSSGYYKIVSSYTGTDGKIIIKEDYVTL